MRWLAGALAALWIGAASAQVGQAPAPALLMPAPSASYTGPIDINGAAVIYAGLRCGSTSYAGNVADVYAPLDASHTLLTCSSGGVINETIQPLSTTCAVSCTVKTLYDQSGSLACAGGTACNFTEPTEASRPTFVANSSGTKPGMVFNGSQGLKTANNLTLSQPLSMSAVGKRTTFNSGNNDNLLNGDSSGTGLLFASTSGTAASFGGAAVLSGSATENVTHPIQGFFNGASSTLFLDTGGGTLSGPSNIGTSGFSAETVSTGQGVLNTLAGVVFELGIWAGDKSANNAAMCANQHNYWGTSISC